MMKAGKIGLLAAALIATSVSADAGVAQEGQGFTLELNALQKSEKGCRLTFLVVNRLGSELSEASFEVALFDETGAVDRLAVLDFKDLPEGKTKVSRFDLAGADCARISRVLVNSATKCAGAGLDPAACSRRLKTENRTAIAFGL